MSAALVELGWAQALVSCRCCTATEVGELNLRFAGVDAPTDVLAFPAQPAPGEFPFRLPPDGPVQLGDIVISVSTARDHALAARVDPRSELRLLLIHGLLHLLGHDHAQESEAAQMTALTRQLLAHDACRRSLPEPLVPALRPHP